MVIEQIVPRENVLGQKSMSQNVKLGYILNACRIDCFEHTFTKQQSTDIKRDEFNQLQYRFIYTQILISDQIYFTIIIVQFQFCFADLSAEAALRLRLLASENSICDFNQIYCKINQKRLN